MTREQRVALLRAKAIEPPTAYERFYLYFFRQYGRNETLGSVENRYADAWAAAFGALPVSIDEAELIVGKSCQPLTQAERQEYAALRENVAKPLFPSQEGQDSHMAVDYDLLLQKGITGLQQYIAQKETALSKDDPARAEKLAYYALCRSCLETVANYADRYATHAAAQAENCSDPVRRAELQKIAAVCARVPRYAANNFYEAVQSVHFLSHCLCYDPTLYGHTMQFQLGHPDRYLYPYYRADIDAGRLTREQARELLDCLGIQINQRVPRGLSSGYMVGGRYPDGTPVANELTTLCMQVIGDIRLVYPAVGLCYNKDMGEEYLVTACEILAQGCSHPAIFNDDLITEGLISYGVPVEEARNYIHCTCVEITPVAASNCWVASPYTNMLQLLLDAMQTDHPDFESLLADIFSRLSVSIKRNFEEQDGYRRERAAFGLSPLLSCFVNDCLEQGLDISRGGARYNWILPSFVGVANLVDSLTALRIAVYEQKIVDLPTLRTAMENNFEGQEPLRLMLLNKLPKYGNDDDSVDGLFGRITEFLDTECQKYQSIFTHADLIPSVFCWIMHEMLGRETGASPDGRKAGFPLGDGSGAAQGRELHGPAASLLSATKWCHKRLIGGVAVNLKFSKKMFCDRSYATMLALIKTYLERGGFELQINVTDRETLLDAVEHPENHRDLVVRIGGYSDYFVRLSPNMQQELLLRTEHEI